MSYSTLWEVYKTKVISVKEFHNGHGTGPAIWDCICQNFLGFEEYSWLTEDHMNTLWPSWENPEIPDFLRFTLMVTYDRSYIEPNRLIEAADYLDKGHEYILAHTSWVWSHFEAIALTLRQLTDRKLDHRLLGIGLGCTSVSDPWEDGYPKYGQTPWGIFEKFDTVGKGD